MKKNIMVLNHHGLGEVLMSFPAIRWLTDQHNGKVFMTVSSNLDKEVCSNQRCGHDVFIFRTKSSILSLLKQILYFRKLNITDVIAMWGFEKKTVRIFALLIGAKNIFVSRVDDYEMTKRNIPHKNTRNISLVSEYLDIKPTTAIKLDYKFEEKLSDTKFLGIKTPYVVFIPGSGAKEKYKRWPIRHFTSLAQIIIEENDKFSIVITGTKEEVGLSEEIQTNVRNSRIINLCGELELDDLKILYKNSLITVGGDNGGMHLANASGAMTIVITGPTNSSLTAPINAAEIIDIKLDGRPWYNRRNCKLHQDTIHDISMDISADIVYEKIEKYFNNSKIIRNKDES